MRRRGRHAGQKGHSALRRLTRALPGPPVPAASAIVLAILALVVLSPAGTAADAGADDLTESAAPTGAAFGGTPAVGALLEGGPQGKHFCTASVVYSPAQDVIVTAAHCVSSFAGAPQSITFVPGYDDGHAPYGAWTVTRIFTSTRWQSDADADDDVAFMTVQGPVQKYTGAEELAGVTAGGSGGAAGVGTVAQVIGYPDGAGAPVTCQNRVRMVSATQMEFDCGGYTDGTSGGPFLTSINAVTGTGTIVGVIGGYEQGGDTPDVSYSPVLGPDVQALYRSAAGQG